MTTLYINIYHMIDISTYHYVHYVQYIYNIMIRDNHMDIDLTWLIAGGDGS